MQKLKYFFRADFFQKVLFPLMLVLLIAIFIIPYILFMCVNDFLKKLSKNSKPKITIAIILVALFLPSCANIEEEKFIPFWQAYDECAVIHQDFVDMVECGKQKRITKCLNENGMCTGSSRGNAFMIFSNSLANSVIQGDLNKEEAQRKWIKLRIQEEDSFEREKAAFLNRQALHSQNKLPVHTNCNSYGDQTFCSSY